jgi:hypothetical protein
MKVQILVVITILIFGVCLSQINNNSFIGLIKSENILSEKEYVLNNERLADSTVDLPPDNGVTDIANMFNERGFYKSNGFSFDEQEIINDFNGNLMYQIPLYNYPLAGELSFNLTMNYNGSVGHQYEFSRMDIKF